MQIKCNSNYPSIDDLIKKAKRRIPKFAFEYLHGGCNEDVNLNKNTGSGPDVARALASGADFTFMGRSFMYGVSALGKEGGNHTISILKTQLQQVMEQICCKTMPNFRSILYNCYDYALDENIGL